MISVHLSLGDETDWFEGLYDFVALPPIGSTIIATDRNGNSRRMRVTDIVSAGGSQKMKRESPVPPQEWITIRCEETS